MSRKFYQVGIFIITLTIINGFYFGIRYLLAGNAVVEAGFYPIWFKTQIVLNFLATVIMAKYYHFKKFNVSFYLSLAYLILIFPEFFAELSLINGRPFGNWDKALNIVLIVFGISYALALFRSNTKSRPYLKTFGKILSVWLSIILILYVSIISTSSPAIINNLEYIFSVLEPLGNLLPVFYILNFSAEIKESSEDSFAAG